MPDARAPKTELRLQISRLVPLVIVIATALPTAFGPARFQWWRWDASDILANILLYLPLGLVLRAQRSIVRTIKVSVALSGAIECAQLFYVNRIGHPLDVVFNVIGAVCGHLAAPHLSRRPDTIRLSRILGAVLLAVAPAWILSSRIFRMFLGGYGWFALERAHPRFWSFLPAWAIQTGAEVHDLGLLANTAIAALLAAAGVIGTLQVQHPVVRIVLSAASGFAVGNMMTPHLNVFPLVPSIVGTGAGILLAACCVPEPREAHTDSNSVRPSREHPLRSPA